MASSSCPDPDPHPLVLHPRSSPSSPPPPFSSFGSFKQKHPPSSPPPPPPPPLSRSLEAPARLQSSPLPHHIAGFSAADLLRELAWARKIKLHEETAEKRKHSQVLENEDGEVYNEAEVRSGKPDGTSSKEGDRFSSHSDAFDEDDFDEIESSSSSSETISSNDDDPSSTSTTTDVTHGIKLSTHDDSRHHPSQSCEACEEIARMDSVHEGDDGVIPTATIGAAPGDDRSLRKENMDSESFSAPQTSSIDGIPSTQDGISRSVHLHERRNSIPDQQVPTEASNHDNVYVTQSDDEDDSSQNLEENESDRNDMLQKMLNKMKSISFSKDRGGRRPKMDRAKSRTWTFTDEDMEELRGSIDLGFGFSGEEAYELKETLPALELYYAINHQRKPSAGHDNYTDSTGHTSPLSSVSALSTTSSPLRDAAYPRFSSPGDRPKDVKQRLRKWAKAVALTIKEGFTA